MKFIQTENNDIINFEMIEHLYVPYPDGSHEIHCYIQDRRYRILTLPKTATDKNGKELQISLNDSANILTILVKSILINESSFIEFDELYGNMCRMFNNEYGYIKLAY